MPSLSCHYNWFWGEAAPPFLGKRRCCFWYEALAEVLPLFLLCFLSSHLIPRGLLSPSVSLLPLRPAPTHSFPASVLKSHTAHFGPTSLTGSFSHLWAPAWCFSLGSGHSSQALLLLSIRDTRTRYDAEDECSLLWSLKRLELPPPLVAPSIVILN